MVHTLKITDLIDRITAKVATINQFVEFNPAIMTRIDYHNTVGKRILLGNEWREVANEWHSLQTRGLTDHMHGVSSIISHTKHKVKTILKRSHQVLQEGIERNPMIGDGGPPVGIPITPAAIEKPSSTIKPGGIRKRKDFYTIEVITVNDESTESKENHGDKNDHDPT